MRFALVALTLAFSTAALAAPPCSPAQMAGGWTDESGTAYVFAGKKGKLKKVVASDGEKYKPRNVSSDPGGFEFTYWVPSTDYVVTTRVAVCAGSHAETTWSNDHDAAGDGYMDRN